MANTIVFYSPKGGQGKTTLAINYALWSGSDYYTNDFLSGTQDLFEEHFEKGRFHTICPEDTELKIKASSVFDFGGWIDGKIPAIVKNADLCVIPISYQSLADLRPLFIVVETISKLNANIAIVINNTKKDFLEELENGINQTFNNKYPIKIVKQSSYMTYLVNEGRTPFELEERGALKKALDSIQGQLSEFFNFIRKY